ncbi:MAG: beta-glucosidase, partial [Actinomycetota bacterium]
MTGTTGTGRSRDEEVERRIDELLAAMTLDERAALSAGIDLWHGPGVARLGVPPIKATDGPSGARGQRWTGRPVACFPSGSTLGAAIRSAGLDPEIRVVILRAEGKGF